jgi:hypothetical protein
MTNLILEQGNQVTILHSGGFKLANNHKDISSREEKEKIKVKNLKESGP